MTVIKKYTLYILIPIIIIIIIFSIIFFLSKHNKINTPVVKTPAVSTYSSPPNKPTNTSTTTSQSNSNTSSQSKTTATSSISAPVAPFGNFVSNYTPNLSGSPSPNLIGSTCNTTPGATCVISFSQNNITKSLPPEVTNSNGASYWTWHLQDIGLTVGYWSITATATLNGKSASTGDTLKLYIQQ